MNDPSCIFCKIVAGQIPCLKVFEDADTLAFLDIGPLAEGHLLVVPREHYVRLDEMPPELVSRLTAQLPRLARAMLKATGAAGYNLLQNNGRVAQQEVQHAHFHLIPRRASDGLGYRWMPSTYPAGRGEEVQRRVVEALQEGG